MKVDFEVHTAVMEKTNAATMVDGEEMQAQVDCLSVEMRTMKVRHGSLTLRFVGTEMEQAKSLFKPGSVITADFSKK